MSGDRLLTGFRSDINGLRAWAVMAVIFYHFNVPGFSGGFVGVDVFFVISGYLMTSIVVKGLEVGHFSLLDFYAARVRRIVPALLVLCVVLLGVGYFVVPPSDYEQLARHAIAALGFFSNNRFSSEAGYFDVASHQKWLLHTWSLSVEWQFYMLLPIVLAAVWRFWPGRTAQLIVFLLGGALSFAASAVMTSQSSSGAFYLLHARAWEMLAGGLVFLLARRLDFEQRTKVATELLGLVMIALAILVFDGGTAWPGWRAALPVLGAMMILAAHRDRSLWTGGHVAQWLGDRSYSLYLWHWPVVVALGFVEQEKNPLAISAGIALTLLLGHASCRWVELPVRRHLANLPPLRFWVGVGAVLGAALLPAFAVRQGSGLEGRLSPEVERAAAASANINPRRAVCNVNGGVDSPSCVWGGDAWRVVALGDSHTSAMVTAIAEAGGKNAGVVQWSYSGCPYVLDLKFTPKLLARKKRNFACQTFVKWATDRLDSLPGEIPVVIASRYAVRIFGHNEDSQTPSKPDAYFSQQYETRDERLFAEFKEAIVKTACQAASRRKVYLVRPIPEMGVDVPRVLSRRLLRGVREDVSITRADYLSRNQWVWEAQDEAARRCGVGILDPTEFLCDADRCYGSRNMQPYFSDDDHLSEVGNKLLVPMFRRVYADPQVHQIDPTNLNQ
jgi:peptidoglycan/LPS O-acetylase OafA/YrhL